MCLKDLCQIFFEKTFAFSSLCSFFNLVDQIFLKSISQQISKPLRFRVRLTLISPFCVRNWFSAWLNYLNLTLKIRNTCQKYIFSVKNLAPKIDKVMSLSRFNASFHTYLISCMVLLSWWVKTAHEAMLFLLNCWHHDILNK